MSDSTDQMDRWMGLAMGMAASRQMAITMNETMDTVRAGGAGNPAAQNPFNAGRVYYAVIDGKQAGPFSETEIVRLINDKRIFRETFLWHPGLSAWKAAENIPEILRLLVLLPPPAPTAPPAPTPGGSQ